LVLSETLDENAVQTLLDLSIPDGSLKQRNEWHAAKLEISDVISRKSTERQHAAFEKLASKEGQLQCALRDAVVGDVAALFPCVLFKIAASHRMFRPLISRSLEGDHLCSYPQSQEAASKNFLSMAF
jgi:hypothetical protein